jgi:hypothetical protein
MREVGVVDAGAGLKMEVASWDGRAIVTAGIEICSAGWSGVEQQTARAAFGECVSQQGAQAALADGVDCAGVDAMANEQGSRVAMSISRDNRVTLQEAEVVPVGLLRDAML